MLLSYYALLLESNEVMLNHDVQLYYHADDYIKSTYLYDQMLLLYKLSEIMGNTRL